MKRLKLKSKLAILVCGFLVATSVPTAIFATDGTATVNEGTAENQPEATPDGGVNTPKDGNTETVNNEPSDEPTQTPNYQGTVQLIGQWTDESSRKEDTTRNYTSGSDKIGEPLKNSGTYRGSAKIFFGWSDKAPVGNGNIADGARMFSKEDPISKAFPQGITADSKLYGVYFSLNNPDEPLPADLVSLGFAVIAGMNKLKINENKVSIDSNVIAENVLPDSKVNTFDKTDEKFKVVENYDRVTYDTKTKEVVLQAEFEMNKAIAMLVYRNPTMGNEFKRVLSRNYGDLQASANGFNINEGKSADYTYVDLHTNLADGYIVPNTLYLEFKGYSWRPLYVLGGKGENREKLNVINPETGENLGNTSNSFDGLLNNTDPKVTFGVETKGHHDITVRMILRDGDKRIDEANVDAGENLTIAEKITENMTLRALNKDEVKKLTSSTDEEASKSVVTISDEVARKLAETKGETTIDIIGDVSGLAVADAGKIGQGWLLFPTHSAHIIEKVVSNILAIGFTENTYSLSYEFESITPGKQLPPEVMNKKPATETGLLNGTGIAPKDMEDVEVAGGVWKFEKWYNTDDDTKTALSEGMIIHNKDVSITGAWRFEANYNVTYTFESGTEGKDLPPAITEMKPQDESKVADGHKVTLPSYGDVKVDGGVWKFTKWYDLDDAQKTKLEKETAVSGKDLSLVGVWVFEKDPEVNPPVDPEQPEPQPPVEPEQPKTTPEEQKPNKQKESKVPDTSDDRSLMGGFAILLLGGVGVLRFRKGMK